MFSVGKKIHRTLEEVLCQWSNFNCCKWQKRLKSNLAIWSHCRQSPLTFQTHSVPSVCNSLSLFLLWLSLSLPSFLSVGKESRFFIQFVAVVIVVVVASKETFEIFSRQISSFLRSVASDKRRDVKNDDNDFHILFQNLLLKGWTTIVNELTLLRRAENSVFPKCPI